MNLYISAVKNHPNSLGKFVNLVKIDYPSCYLMIISKMSKSEFYDKIKTYGRTNL